MSDQSLSNCLAWLSNSFETSGFEDVHVLEMFPTLAMICGARNVGDVKEVLVLLVGSNGTEDMETEAQELSLTLTRMTPGGGTTQHDLYDKEAYPFSLFVYEPEDGYVQFDNIIEIAMDKHQALLDELAKLRADIGLNENNLRTPGDGLPMTDNWAKQLNNKAS